MTTTIVVPVRDAIRHTRAFLDAIDGEAHDRLIVVDNGSAQPTRRLLSNLALRDERVRVLRRPGLGIYAMWSDAFDLASRGRREVNVLISNNDVILPPGGVAALADALRSRPDLWVVYPDYDWPWAKGPRVRGLRYTEGVLGDGGMLGACFMLAAERIEWRPLVSDTEYEWWFGDNHLARQIREAGGRQARVCGLPILHVNEGTARNHRELAAMKTRDRRRWIESERLRAPARRAERPPRKHVPGTKVWRPGGARPPE